MMEQLNELLASRKNVFTVTKQIYFITCHRKGAMDLSQGSTMFLFFKQEIK